MTNTFSTRLPLNDRLALNAHHQVYAHLKKHDDSDNFVNLPPEQAQAVNTVLVKHGIKGATVNGARLLSQNGIDHVQVRFTNRLSEIKYFSTSYNPRKSDGAFQWQIESNANLNEVKRANTNNKNQRDKTNKIVTPYGFFVFNGRKFIFSPANYDELNPHANPAIYGENENLNDAETLLELRAGYAPHENSIAALIKAAIHGLDHNAFAKVDPSMLRAILVKLNKHQP